MSELAYYDEALSVKDPEVVGQELGQRVLGMLKSGTTDGRIITFYLDCPLHIRERVAFLEALDLENELAVPLFRQSLRYENGVALICDVELGWQIKPNQKLVPCGWSYQVIPVEEVT